VPGSIDSFVAGDYTGNSLVLDKTRDDVSHASFKFDTLPGVTFEVARVQLAQSDPAFDGTFPAGWLDIVGVDSSGAVVSGSGSSGPTEESVPLGPQPSAPSPTDELVEFTFDNFPQATFAASRSNERLETAGPWGRQIREAGWVDLFVTLNGATWQIAGFAGPTAR
jgi:hypothetical protein